MPLGLSGFRTCPSGAPRRYLHFARGMFGGSGYRTFAAQPGDLKCAEAAHGGCFRPQDPCEETATE
eukprot:6857944-Alexandrium_andersonii.AAC.1